MNRSILAFASTFALVGISHATVIVDDFESYSPVFGDMNGQGAWTVTNGNPVIPAEGPVVIIDSSTWDGSAQSATVGGVQPTTAALTSMSRAASVSLGHATTFEIETRYTESTSGGRNNFQFVLSSTAGNLLTINMTPGGAGEYDFSWSSAFATGGLIGSKLAGVSTQFQLDTWWTGSAVAYSLTNAGSGVASGVLSGGIGSSDSITGLAVTWDSTSGSGVGNNSITVDNITLVPEPSSALLGMLGAAFAVVRRRRA